MVMLPIYLISQNTLEKWDYDTPFSTGIGGSETAHIECAIRLAKRGYDVISHCPLPAYKASRVHEGVKWLDCEKEPFPSEPCIILNYRSPKIFDRKKPKGQKWWFIAQDVDYDNCWTEQAIKNTDRFLALCQTHVDFTHDKYPGFIGKVYMSSNGIRTDYIEKLPPQVRQPHRMFWASSPDRGLVCLLENWFRIRERFPDAELRIAYGFNNMDTIINWQGPNSPLIPLREQLRSIANQPGVTWLGRLTQDKVFEEWQQASVLPYCSDWPETSPLVGSTYIETLSGRVQLKDLVGKETYVYSCNKEGALSISKAWGCEIKRKNAETVTLTYRRERGNLSGKDIKLTLTPDHEVMLSSGEYKQAGELKPGDSIKAFTRRKGEYGNGYDTIGITNTPYQPEHRFVASYFAGRPLTDGEVVDHWDTNKRNNEPENLIIHPSQSEHVKSHYARMTPEEYDEYCAQKRVEQATIWGALSPEERTKRARNIVAGRWGTAANHKITKVEPGPREDVYCMQSDPDHNFIANELVVHNCISIMEAMACGAIPVTTNYWAQGEHAGQAPLSYVIDGLPQKSELAKSLWLNMLYEVLDTGFDARARMLNSPKGTPFNPSVRENLMTWARKRYDWERVIDQWEGWLKEDMKPVKEEPKKKAKRKR